MGRYIEPDLPRILQELCRRGAHCTGINTQRGSDDGRICLLGYRHRRRASALFRADSFSFCGLKRRTVSTKRAAHAANAKLSSFEQIIPVGGAHFLQIQAGYLNELIDAVFMGSFFTAPLANKGDAEKLSQCASAVRDPDRRE